MKRGTCILLGVLHDLHVHSESSVLRFNVRPMSSVFQITHINLCIPHISAFACTIVMEFLNCNLTSSLNL